MSISADKVWFDGPDMWLLLSDGRRLSVPLAWFPILASASSEDRAAVEISPFGLHWPNLDEDVSVEGLLSAHAEGDAA